MFHTQPITTGMDPEGAVQAWIFQQFLPLLVIGPVAASMSIAAYAVVGEKQARTLEPLLATPITTVELLAAKVLGSLLPSLALTVLCFAVYGVAIASFAHPGVYRILLAPRSLGLFFVLGPLAALAALQLAVCTSSRVNDARTAQQIGVLIILPLAAALVGQLTGALMLTMPIIAVIAAALVLVNIGLMAAGVRLFNRESILTRWK
jgi:ABC-2 type transport system permease protein